MAESKKVEVTPDLCWKCGHCVAACPVEAIDHSEYPLSVCPPINGDSVVKYEDLIGTFRERRSTRVFKEKQIPRDILQELLEIGRYAPTGSNSQSIDWLVIDNPGHDQGAEHTDSTSPREYGRSREKPPFPTLFSHFQGP